ncbi:hypothetical protein FRC00_005669 [Tulasnella sp. 408]|nr:hypothetical protein FRC00_005669 [Tulasnella sp. 408]
MTISPPSSNDVIPTLEYQGSVWELLGKKWQDEEAEEAEALELLSSPPPAASPLPQRHHAPSPPKSMLPVPSGRSGPTPSSGRPQARAGQARLASTAFLTGIAEPLAKRTRPVKESPSPAPPGPHPLPPRPDPFPLAAKRQPRKPSFISAQEGHGRKQRRDLRRAAEFAAAKASGAAVVEAPVTLSSQPRTGEYRGKPRKASSRLPPRKPSRTIPAGDWPLSLPAAVVEKEERRLFIWRSYGYPKAREMDHKIQQAVRKLELTTKPEIQPGHSRGNFTMRQFMVHRSYTSAPRSGSYLQNLAAAKTLADDLADIIKLING